MTPFFHRPVLLEEVAAALQPRSGQLLLDGTVGGGGHSFRLLEASSPEGRLIGLDRDEQALAAAAEKLSIFQGRFELHHANFAELGRYVVEASCDAILLDLGISSPQIDQAERGFSFQESGPLDMRMNRGDAITAAHIVNTWPAEELANLFWRLADERDSRRLARAIEKRRQVRPFSTTKELADFLGGEMPRGRGKIHPATRVFQALRMEVNQELPSLEAGLKAAWEALKAGGRLAVITFHSLEDRMVKDFGRELARDYEVEGEVDVPELRKPRPPQARWISRKAIPPGEQEIAENPRARSAQLRVLEKL